MATPSTDALRAALREIKDPASGRDIVAAGLVEGIQARDGFVQVTLLTDRAHAAAMEPVRRAAEAALARQPGVTNATAILTAHKGPPPSSAPAARQGNAAPQGHAAHGPGPAKAPLLLPDVKSIVAVESG
jgi:ATP-binding protein involved in chromosome partitioning